MLVAGPILEIDRCLPSLRRPRVLLLLRSHSPGLARVTEDLMHEGGPTGRWMNYYYSLVRPYLYGHTRGALVDIAEHYRHTRKVGFPVSAHEARLINVQLNIGSCWRRYLAQPST